MKFYIASGLQNHEQVRSLAKLLKNSGWTHTYDWTSLLMTGHPMSQRKQQISKHSGILANRSIMG